MNSKNTWRVHVPRRVVKAIRKFPRNDCQHILEILCEFEVDPWSGDVIKLGGEKDSWRRRVGSYRIFYSVYVEQNLVEIKEIERRTSSTY